MNALLWLMSSDLSVTEDLACERVPSVAPPSSPPPPPPAPSPRSSSSPAWAWLREQFTIVKRQGEEERLALLRQLEDVQAKFESEMALTEFLVNKMTEVEPLLLQTEAQFKEIDKRYKELETELLHSRNRERALQDSLDLYELELKRQAADAQANLEKEAQKRKKAEEECEKLQERIEDLEFLLDDSDSTHRDTSAGNLSDAPESNLEDSD